MKLFFLPLLFVATIGYAQQSDGRIDDCSDTSCFVKVFCNLQVYLDGKRDALGAELYKNPSLIKYKLTCNVIKTKSAEDKLEIGVHISIDKEKSTDKISFGQLTDQASDIAKHLFFKVLKKKSCNTCGFNAISIYYYSSEENIFFKISYAYME